MSRFQALIFSAMIFLGQASQAENCLEYSIHGVVQEKDSSVVMLLNPESRSEIKVQFPQSMQKVLKNYLGHRIQVEAPAVLKNNYFYQVYYQEGKVKSYPFTSEKRDQITAAPLQKPFPCE